MDLKHKLTMFLHWSQKYTKTDMLYATKGGFWVLTRKAGGLIISFASTLAFGNWLPKEEYGTYQFMLAVAILASIFALPGVKTALIKSIAQGKEGTLHLAIKSILKWSLLGSAILIPPIIWYVINHNYKFAIAFLIVALFVPSQSVFPIFQEFWNGRKRFDMQTKYGLTSSALATSVLIAVLYFTDSVLIVLFAYFASFALFQGIFLLKTLQHLKNNEEDKEAVPFGKSLTLMGAIGTISNHIDKIILLHFLGPIQVAIYSFARLPITITGGIMPIRAIALPKLGEKNIRDIKGGLMDKFFRLFVLSIPIAIILALVAPLVYSTFIPNYTDSVVYFQALTILLAIIPFSLLELALISNQRKKDLYVIKTVPPIIRIFLFLILAPVFGIWGIVWSLISTEILKGLLMLYYFKKI